MRCVVLAVATPLRPSSCRPGDVDLFLVGPTEGGEQAVLGKIFDITMASCRDLRGENARLLVTRSKAAVTLFKHKGAPIQIILSTYQTVEELLADFDIDCACCAYVLGTGQFVCSARGRRALECPVVVASVGSSFFVKIHNVQHRTNSRPHHKTIASVQQIGLMSCAS